MVEREPTDWRVRGSNPTFYSKNLSVPEKMVYVYETKKVNETVDETDGLQVRVK